MKLVDFSVRNGTAVVVGMILVVLFGLLALERIPIQLNPTIDRPIVEIDADYPGAAPSEVESEVTRELEERLATVENVRRMVSRSGEGEAQITMEFEWGVNKDLARMEISEKLNLVGDLPDQVEKPQIFAADSEEDRSIFRMTVQSELPVDEERELLEDTVGPRLERIEGVGRVRWWGGSRREIQVLLDLPAMESRRVTIAETIAALRAENRNQRGGRLEGGAARLLVRTVGQFESIAEVEETIVRDGPDGPIRIRDVAQVVDGYAETERVGRTMGEPSVSMSISKKSGANTLRVTEALRAEIEKINVELAPLGIRFWVTYDAADYIWDSIRGVRGSLIFGGALATIVLLLFLRSLSATFAIGVMIPVCTIATFVLLAAFGRSVNVISLAGLAFAGGMVVDNGIVVIENIHRHRKEFGSDPFKAARDAAVEVWAPILASTLTTLAVFVPILFIQEEAGQMFRDIAYSISFAVGISMIAAITIVPMIAARLTGRAIGAPDEPMGSAPASPDDSRAKRVWRRVLAADPSRAVGRVVAEFFVWIVRASLGRKSVRAGVLAVIALAFVANLWLAPPAEYLPQSRSTFVFGNVQVPSGVSLEGVETVVSRVERFVLSEVPHLFRTFFVFSRDSSFFGIFLEKNAATDEVVEKVVADVRAHAAAVLPSDFRLTAFRSSDFGWGSEGKSVQIDLRGPDLKTLETLAADLDERLSHIPDVINVNSSLRVSNPEIRVEPDRERLADLGLSAADLGLAVETAIEGTLASVFRSKGKEYDLVLMARPGQIDSPDDLRGLMLKTPTGQDVRLDEVARVERGLGPTTILRIEQERAISLSVTIDEATPLETFLEEVETEALEPLRGGMPPGYFVELSGSADDLRRTVAALGGSFALALVIIYLLMAALFESFLHPLIIMLSVPLATTGAFLGVILKGAEFNVITMLGFILLAGIVVNNAILLVEFGLRNVRAGMEIHEAVLDAVRARLRPIFMTSATTVLGMAPLVIGGGAGTELYEGLGAAVVGGMTFSTVFTLVLVPLILVTFLEARQWTLARFAATPLLGGLARRDAEGG